VSVFIIAEAGVNHNGSIELAYKLIDAAYDAGANAVKFQTFKANNIAIQNSKKAEYQIQKNNIIESQFDMLKKLELNADEHKKLFNYCTNKGITFLSSPFDHESIRLLDKLNVQIFKIPSGEINNLPYLRHIGSLGKEVILSTGMSSLKEIDEALNILINSGTAKNNITILHANTMYPTPMEDVNLNAMQTIKNKFDVAVGYSDHTLGIEVDIAAAALGASVIEKHFTLDKKMDGPDHKASLEPNELKSMIGAIRNIEKAMGDGVKRLTRSEKPNITIARKSIVAKTDIKKGDIFSEKNLTTKRPGNGLSPMNWDSVVGKIAVQDFNLDDLIC
jgi:N,N'-diacetyllegionaminate synthase